MKEDEDIYDETEREEQLEEDEISPSEAGFMEGYEKLRFVKCRQCNKGVDLAKAIEVEIKGNDYLFCSEKCAGKYSQKHGLG